MSLEIITRWKIEPPEGYAPPSWRSQNTRINAIHATVKEVDGSVTIGYTLLGEVLKKDGTPRKNGKFSDWVLRNNVPESVQRQAFDLHGEAVDRFRRYGVERRT